MTQVAFRAGEKLEKQLGKRKILEMATYFPDTPEKGKASHYSGELPPRDQAMYPGKRKNKSLQWCKETPPHIRSSADAAARSGDVPRKKEKQVITEVQGNAPSHTFVGRRRREIRRCTPEVGKKQVIQRCKEMPPRLCLVGKSLLRREVKRPSHIRSSAGRRKSKLLPRLYSLVSLYFCGNCGCNFSMRDLRHRRCIEGVFCPHAPLRVSSKCERSRMGKLQSQLSFKT